VARKREKYRKEDEFSILQTKIWLDVDQLYLVVGERIREARLDANMTAEQVATFLGWPVPNYINIEGGISSAFMKIEHLYLLARKLGVDVHSFLPDRNEI
jgi:hypothetical protein